MKRFFFCILSLSYFISLIGQDIIVDINGEEIQAIVKEVSESEISFVRFNNPNGPLYRKNSSSIQQIKYESGHTDSFNQNVISLEDDVIKESEEQPLLLLKRKNKVYIKISDEASKAGEKYFIQAMKDWGYWNVVENENEAHFIIEFHIDKKAMLNKASWVVLKTRNQTEIQRSKSYISTTNAFNGYNAFKAAARKIVNSYFKEHFN